MDAPSINYKNQLQEYYQRYHPKWDSNGKHVLPRYEHSRDGSTGGWATLLTLPDGGGQFTGSGQNKKISDQAAAARAVIFLQERAPPSGVIENPTPPPLWSVAPQGDGFVKQNPPNIEWRLPGCVLVLIDLENSPGHDKARWNHVRWDCSRVEAFVGKLSSHATKDLASLYPFVTHFHIVDSGHRDAVDHAISCRAGQWVESMKHATYYLEGEEGCLYDECIHIITRDRFGPALVDVLRQLPPPEEEGCLSVVHSINIDECFGLLEQASNKYSSK